MDIGLNIFAFDECLNSVKYDDRIDHNKQVGMSHGVKVTPTFFIVDNGNGLTEKIDGPQSYSVFAKVIDDMITSDDPMVSEVLPEEIISEIENKEEMELKEITSSVEEQREDDTIISEAETLAEQVGSEVEDKVEEMMPETTSEVENIETMIDEKSEINVNVGDNSDNGGGCLIATAAYGSELTPQVQFLREIRDNTVMSTESGAAFMTGFNQLYYSLSPTIADMDRENPMFQETIRTFITPMISTLSIMTLAEEGNDAQVLGLGISVIALNLGMYIATPAVALWQIEKQI